MLADLSAERTVVVYPFVVTVICGGRSHTAATDEVELEASAEPVEWRIRLEIYLIPVEIESHPVAAVGHGSLVGRAEMLADELGESGFVAHLVFCAVIGEEYIRAAEQVAADRAGDVGAEVVLAYLTAHIADSVSPGVLTLRGDLCLHAADSTGVVIVKTKIVSALIAADSAYAFLPLVVTFFHRWGWECNAADGAFFILVKVVFASHAAK
jgi:hypothetical protein